jgi:hypothetical protein
MNAPLLGANSKQLHIQLDSETRANSILDILGIHVATMQLSDLLTDCETESRTSLIASRRHRRLSEMSKQLMHFILLNPGPSCSITILKIPFTCSNKRAKGRILARIA